MIRLMNPIQVKNIPEQSKSKKLVEILLGLINPVVLLIIGGLLTYGLFPVIQFSNEKNKEYQSEIKIVISALSNYSINIDEIISMEHKDTYDEKIIESYNLAHKELNKKLTDFKYANLVYYNSKNDDAKLSKLILQIDEYDIVLNSIISNWTITFTEKSEALEQIAKQKIVFYDLLTGIFKVN
jgi:hypothetical protein